MRLTPKIVEALSTNRASGLDKNATLVVDGDVVYITNGQWMLVLTRPEDHINADLLSYLRTALADGAEADWRVLGADTIDFVQGRFLPSKSRKYEEILSQGRRAQRPADCRALTERLAPSIFGETTDLTTLYEEGRGRPVYSKQGSGGHATSRGAASAFWFRLGDRVVAIDAGWLEAFSELGFRVLCPTTLEGHDGMPTFGLMHEDADIFGFTAGTICSGILQDLDGRDIYRDATVVSWSDPHAALEALSTPTAHPVAGPPRSIAEALESPDISARTTVRAAVGVLRWNGWAEDEIERAYEEARSVAMGLWYETITRTARGYLAEIMSSRVPTSSWRLTRISEETQRLCAWTETVQAHVDIELDLGDLQRLVQALPQEKHA